MAGQEDRVSQQDSIRAFMAGRAQRPGWTTIPEAHRPGTIADGYQLLAAIHAEVAAGGDRRVGWKVGSTSAAGQKAFAITEPVYAGLFESGRAKTLAEGLARPLIKPSVECEITLVLARPLDGHDLSDAALADAVGSCHISCEIIDNRYGDPMAQGVPSLIADDFFHAAFVIGAEKQDWRTADLGAVEASITIDGTPVFGAARDVLSAFASLRWLAGKRAAAGQPLQAGEIVMTGSITTPTPISLPARSVVMSITGFQTLEA